MFAAFGAMVGSFANVLILRFISHQPIGMDRSRCPNCKHVLQWYALVPIFSYVFLRGRCRYCGKGISFQYPLVEFISGAAALYFFAFNEEVLGVSVILYAAFMILLVLFVIDLKTFLLPDFYIILLSVIVILYHATGSLIGPTQQFGGVLIGAGSLLLLWAGTRGKGIGFGDVKLLVPLGLLFGIHGTILLLFIAFLTGGLFGGVLLLTKRATPKTAIPFGPFLAGAAMILLIYPALIPFFGYVFLGPYYAVL